MRKCLTGTFVVLMLLLGTDAARTAAQQGAPPATPPPPGMLLKSAAFSDGADLPAKYGCDVAQGAPMVSPALTWTNTPKGTVTFVLIMHDLDTAPQKGLIDITHWTAFNIPGTATSLPEGIAPDASVADTGMQGKNMRNIAGYQGPCPPKGGIPHHYLFDLYALDTKLDLPPGSLRVDILKAMDGHVLGKASYMTLFHRQ
jgi:Raf kinase inhibitor-like YbhB/YbcL family protein